MAHGSADPTTGIWVYGEDDASGAAGGSTFSAFMNLLANSLVTLLTSILTRLTRLEARATLQLTAATATANNTALTVPFDSTDIVNTLAGAFSITRASGLFVCVTAGTWQFDLDLLWVSNATGGRVLIAARAPQATPTIFTQEVLTGLPTPVTGAAFSQQLRYVRAMAVGDVVRFQALQGSGGALNITGAHLSIKQLA